jgi:two-component system, NarL family, nitrate/nitrite response regulator NarL
LSKEFVQIRVGHSVLSASVKGLQRGDLYVPPSLAARILSDTQAVSHRQTDGAYRRSPGNLTAREEQILKLIARGKSNREIGESLNIAEKTVKNYVTSVFQKLQVRNRVEAALVARQRNELT